MKHRNLLAVLLTAPLLVAPTCMQQLLGARIEFHPESMFVLSPDGSTAIGSVWKGSSVGTVVWKNGVVVELPIPLWLQDTSYDGRVIVGYTGGDHPARWKDGELTVLWPVAGESRAKGVSWDGEVVVGIADDPNLPASGVMWLGDSLIPLTTEDGFRADSAIAVSADGEVILGLGEDADGNSGRYLWRAGEITWVAGLPGADPRDRSYVYMSISGDGTTVVDEDRFPLPGPDGELRRAFRWRDGIAEPLGSLEGAPQPSSNASAVTANGEVIVGDAMGPDGYPIAMIWDPTHGMRSLESLLLELGVEVPEGKRLYSVDDISSDGRRILGSVYPGFYETFIVTLPPACADRLDNDGDGDTDFPHDRGCDSHFDESEDS
ncbi:MAG TPA: hypothetical protein VNF72_07720 [Myxococcota bacterium]|jgi:uncharacterized membrane protein|nr:hypothetical protein [Myxococcota bacterium]